MVRGRGGNPGLVEQLARSLGDALVPWGYVLLAVLTALEASAFIGLAVPGEAALLFAGYLAFRGRFDLPTAVLAASVGALVGDSIGYEIGRRFGDRLKDSRVGRTIGEERWERSRAFVADHGPSAVFLGRWIGVLRAVVPAVVGDARMRYPRFLFWNACGALTWAPVVVGAGYLAGRSYRRVEAAIGKWSLVAAALVVVALVVVVLVRKHRDRHPAPDRGG